MDHLTNKQMLQEAHFWRFILWCYGPLVLPLSSLTSMLWIGIALNLLISLSVPRENEMAFSKMWTPERGFEAFLMLLLPLFLFYLLMLAYRLYIRVSHWFPKFLIVYGFWILDFVILGALLLAQVGGVSMAAAEGAVTRRGLYVASVSEAIHLISLGQLFLVPWVCFSVWIIEKKSKKNHAPPHS